MDLIKRSDFLTYTHTHIIRHTYTPRRGNSLKCLTARPVIDDDGHPSSPSGSHDRLRLRTENRRGQ